MQNAAPIHYARGGQPDNIREPQFRRQHLARAMYSTQKFIKSKYRSIINDERPTEILCTNSFSYSPAQV
jgi:hypothetical protein